MWRDPDPDLAAIRDSVQWVGGLSDSIVKFGPFSLGVDGSLALHLQKLNDLQALRMGQYAEIRSHSFQELRRQLIVPCPVIRA